MCTLSEFSCSLTWYIVGRNCFSLRSMAVLSSRAHERRSREIRSRSARERAAPAPISSRFLCPCPPLLLSAANQNRHATQARIAFDKFDEKAKLKFFLISFVLRGWISPSLTISLTKQKKTWSNYGNAMNARCKKEMICEWRKLERFRVLHWYTVWQRFLLKRSLPRIFYIQCSFFFLFRSGEYT